MAFKPTFRVSREGLDQVLGSLERAIMEALWDLGRPATVADVQKQIQPEREYHTVTTVMVRLCGKGLLHRAKQKGVWHYAPTLSRDEFAARIARELMGGVLDLAPGAAVASFVDLLDSRDPEALDMLERMIQLKRTQRRTEE